MACIGLPSSGGVIHIHTTGVDAKTHPSLQRPPARARAFISMRRTGRDISSSVYVPSEFTTWRHPQPARLWLSTPPHASSIPCARRRRQASPSPAPMRGRAPTDRRHEPEHMPIHIDIHVPRARRRRQPFHQHRSETPLAPTTPGVPSAASIPRASGAPR
jgi:hypothetical protein